MPPRRADAGHRSRSEADVMARGAQRPFFCPASVRSGSRIERAEHPRPTCARRCRQIAGRAVQVATRRARRTRVPRPGRRRRPARRRSALDASHRADAAATASTVALRAPPPQTTTSSAAGTQRTIASPIARAVSSVSEASTTLASSCRTRGTRRTQSSVNRSLPVLFGGVGAEVGVAHQGRDEFFVRTGGRRQRAAGIEGGTEVRLPSSRRSAHCRALRRSR